MYAWLWRKLPFGLYGKLAGSLLLVGAATALLWFVFFPWVEPMVMPWDDVQVEDPFDDGVDPGTGPGGGTSPTPTDDPHRIDYPTEEPSPTPSTRRR